VCGSRETDPLITVKVTRVVRRVTIGAVVVALGVTLAACGSAAPPKPHYDSGVPAPTTAPITKTTPTTSPTPTTVPTPTTAPPTTTPSTIPTLVPPPIKPTASVPQPTGFVLRTNTPTQAITRGTPEWVAERFVSFAESMSARWSDPYQWVYSVRNFVAPSYFSSLLASASSAVSTAQWNTIVETDAGVWVEPISAVVPGDNLSGPVSRPGATTTNVVVRFKVGKLVGPTTAHAHLGTLVHSTVVPLTLTSSTWAVSGPQTPYYGT